MQTTETCLTLYPFQISYNGDFFPKNVNGEPAGISEFHDLLINNLLSIIPSILNGEISSISFLDDPHYLYFIPWGNEITIILETQVTDYYKNWQTILVPTDTWLKSVMSVAEMHIAEIHSQSRIPTGTSIYSLEYSKCHAKQLMQTQGYLSNGSGDYD